MPDLAAARVHAFADDALADHDAVGLTRLLAAGRVSAAELVDAAIARTQALDPRLAAVAAERYDRARSEGRAPAGGFFSGIPTFVKDNSDLEGLPTQQGTAAYAGRPRTRHGDFARMLTALGVVPLGKTRLSEFGFSASAEFLDEPPVRNPWSPEHTSGASSAGSAALVAAGAVPLAHANDGGGSIRIPAACCGLVGLKPTRDRIVSDALTRQMPVRIVADGVVTRSVRDSAAFLREAEKVYRTLSLPPVGDITRAGRRRLRIALITESIGGRTVDAETASAVTRVAGELEEAGHHVEPVAPPVPESFADDFLLYWATLALHLTRTGRLTLDRSFDRRRTDNLTQGLARHALRNAWRLPGAMRRLRATSRTSATSFADHDVVLSPTVGHLTPRLGHLHPGQEYDVIIDRLLDWVCFTPWQNATGDPAISLPAGLSSQGLPIGVMLAAPHGRDARLLELAYEVEERLPFPVITR